MYIIEQVDWSIAEIKNKIENFFAKTTCHVRCDIMVMLRSVNPLLWLYFQYLKKLIAKPFKYRLFKHRINASTPCVISFVDYLSSIKLIDSGTLIQSSMES